MPRVRYGYCKWPRSFLNARDDSVEFVHGAHVESLFTRHNSELDVCVGQLFFHVLQKSEVFMSLSAIHIVRLQKNKKEQQCRLITNLLQRVDR